MSLKDYFAFNKRQRNGVIVFVVLIMGMIAYLAISDYLPAPKSTEDFSAFKADMAKVKFKPADTIINQPVVKDIDTVTQTKKPKTGAAIELNTADSADFSIFPLVSPKVARTIVRFRNALGGYYDKKQLLEVYGMDTAAYQSIIKVITLNTSLVQRFDLNHATEKDLARHPYIHKPLAKAIIDYRKQNGHFTQISDLLKVDGISKELYAKLAPYFTITK